jgi:hypothetical protein
LVDTALVAGQMLLDNIEPCPGGPLEEFERPLVVVELGAKLSAAEFVGKKMEGTQILVRNWDPFALQRLEEFVEQGAVRGCSNVVDVAIEETWVQIE